MSGKLYLWTIGILSAVSIGLAANTFLNSYPSIERKKSKGVLTCEIREGFSERVDVKIEGSNVRVSENKGLFNPRFYSGSVEGGVEKLTQDYSVYRKKIYCKTFCRNKDFENHREDFERADKSLSRYVGMCLSE